MPTYGKNFSSKFLYLQEHIAVGFLDFQNPKIQKKSENTKIQKQSENSKKNRKYKKNPKSAVSPCLVTDRFTQKIPIEN